MGNKLSEELVSLWPHIVFNDDDSIQDTAFILGPVTPEWTGASFCEPLVNALIEMRYKVYVVDSITPLLSTSEISLETAFACYANFISELKPFPTLIAGYAIGGTLAMALIGYLPNVKRVLSLSGPGFVDAPLAQELSKMIAFLNQNDLDRCLKLLSYVVSPLGTMPNETHSDVFDGKNPALAIRRMRCGFQTLLKLDVRPYLRNYMGRLLTLTGGKSQLATSKNLGFKKSNNVQFIHAKIQGAGMRILFDNPEACICIIKDWLEDEKESSCVAG